MKLFIITLCCMVLAANAMTYVPYPQRLRRDVSELLAEPSGAYLPPQNQDFGAAEVISEEPAQTIATDEEEPSQTIATNEGKPAQTIASSAEEPAQTPEEAQPEISEPEVQDTAVLGENGYEYKAAQESVFRKRRDVSHLKLNYLPPFESQQPSNEYLPPVNNNLNEESLTSEENVSPAEPKENELESVTEAPKPSGEYLPPVEAKESEEISTEVPEPTKEYLPPAKVEETEPTTNANDDLSTETPEVTTIAPEEETTAEVVEAATEPTPEDSAIFAEDGYHYKKPSEVPAELFASEPKPSIDAVSGEYLLPLEGDIVEAEGPSGGEAAVLAEDGYHYRVIKRRF